MSLVKIPVRLASRRNLDKSDVESVYGECVRVIGGTYYSQGAAQGPANGLLDYRNFSTSAGIPNSMRVAPYHEYIVDVRARAYVAGGAVSFYTATPLNSVGMVPAIGDMIATDWIVTASTVAAAVNAITIQVGYVRGGAFTQIDTAALTNYDATATGHILRAGGSNYGVALLPGDLVRFTLTSNVNMTDVASFLYVKSHHVK